jgi:hypothetical protein
MADRKPIVIDAGLEHDHVTATGTGKEIAEKTRLGDNRSEPRHRRYVCTRARYSA